MNVFFPLTVDNAGGKAAFLYRLKKVIGAYGIEVVTNRRKSHEVSLHISRISHKSKSKKIIRIDGVYHNNKENWKTRNLSMKHSAKMADGIIYQSKFSQQMGHKYLGKHDKEIVIHNGVDYKWYNKIPIPEKQFERNYLAAAKWRPHKRLTDIIESFILLDDKDACLHVAGNIKNSRIDWQKYKDHPNIKFLGQVSQKTLGGLFKMCDASIHLCWFDSCPNSVIEALGAGCPVISNNTGGTPELIQKAGGIICEVDQEYRLQPVDLYNPPVIDRNIIAEAMITCVKEPPRINRKAVHIAHVAKQYASFFRKFSRLKPKRVMKRFNK